MDIDSERTAPPASARRWKQSGSFEPVALLPASSGTILSFMLSSGIAAVTDLLDRAIARTRALPPDMQDEAARLLLLYVGEDGPAIQLTPEEEADLREADAEIARGELATQDEIEAIRAKYRL